MSNLKEWDEDSENNSLKQELTLESKQKIIKTQ